MHARVPIVDKPKYRRKGEISVNILAICDRNMNFVYTLYTFLTGWEGSAADSRVLKDAVTRLDCFKVPIGIHSPQKVPVLLL